MASSGGLPSNDESENPVRGDPLWQDPELAAAATAAGWSGGPASRSDGGDDVGTDPEKEEVAPSDGFFAGIAHSLRAPAFMSAMSDALHAEDASSATGPAPTPHVDEQWRRRYGEFGVGDSSADPTDYELFGSDNDYLEPAALSSHATAAAAVR